MPDLINLPCKTKSGHVNMVVEAPRGSLVKLKFDPVLGVFNFHKALPLGVVYPYDWGFVPSTRGEDGDALDGMLLFDAPTWPGVVIPARPIGVVRMTQKEKKKGRSVRNDRIIFVPTDDERYDDVSDLPVNVREQLETFFVTVSGLSDNKVTVDGWKAARFASKLITKGAAAYSKRGGAA